MSMPEPNKRKSLEALRVYAPSRGNLAIESESLPYTRVAEPLPKTSPRRRPALVPKAPAERRRSLAEVFRANKVLAKTTAVIGILAVALALLVMISGYNKITAAQKEINNLSREVSEMESSVEKANIEYLFSIDIGSAHDAANAAGMRYPVSGNVGR